MLEEIQLGDPHTSQKKTLNFQGLSTWIVEVAVSKKIWTTATCAYSTRDPQSQFRLSWDELGGNRGHLGWSRLWRFLTVANRFVYSSTTTHVVVVVIFARSLWWIARFLWIFVVFIVFWQRLVAFWHATSAGFIFKPKARTHILGDRRNKWDMNVCQFWGQDDFGANTVD